MLAGQPAQILIKVCCSCRLLWGGLLSYQHKNFSLYLFRLYLIFLSNILYFQLYRFSTSFLILHPKYIMLFVLFVNGFLFNFSFGLFISTEKWSVLECMLNISHV